jgi:hypothetical protein
MSRSLTASRLEAETLPPEVQRIPGLVEELRDELDRCVRLRLTEPDAAPDPGDARLGRPRPMGEAIAEAASGDVYAAAKIGPAAGWLARLIRDAGNRAADLSDAFADPLPGVIGPPTTAERYGALKAWLVQLDAVAAVRLDLDRGTRGTKRDHRLYEMCRRVAVRFRRHELIYEGIKANMKRASRRVLAETLGAMLRALNPDATHTNVRRYVTHAMRASVQDSSLEPDTF